MLPLRLALFSLAVVVGLHCPALAQESDAEACDRLAASPYDPESSGLGVTFERIDAEAAIAACTKAVELDPANTKLRFQLGRALDAANRTDEAIAAYEAAAEQGSLLAVSALGSLYDGGYGVAEDAAKAAEYYQRAADGGLPLGLTNLGYLYEQGRGVAQDYARAAELYRQAADAGSALGAGSLGYLTEMGLGVAKDDVEAVRLYKIAADAGEAFAQRNMGVMYSAGRGGLMQSHEEALRYFKLSGDQGYAKSYIDLSAIYRDGRGVTPDPVEAERYLRLALEEGDDVVKGDAQNDLAWLFALQNRDLAEAEELARAAVAVDPEKANKLDTLAWVLHLAGKDAEALPIAEKAVQLDANDAVFTEHLAEIRKAN